MLCRFVEKNLSAYLDKETNIVVSFIISKHLNSCERCRAKLALLSRISGFVKQKEEVKLSSDFMQVLKAKITEEKIKKQTVALPVFEKRTVALKLSLSVLGIILVFVSIVLVAPRINEKQTNEFATFAFQTKAEVVDSGSGLEYATFTNQTRR